MVGRHSGAAYALSCHERLARSTTILIGGFVIVVHTDNWCSTFVSHSLWPHMRRKMLATYANIGAIDVETLDP